MSEHAGSAHRQHDRRLPGVRRANLIRKSAIAVLACAAIIATSLFGVSFVKPFRWKCYRSDSRRVCLEVQHGNLHVQSVVSIDKEFLDLLDFIEGDEPITDGNRVTGFEVGLPYDDASSYRFGFTPQSFPVIILLLAAYPLGALIRGPVRRRRRRRRGLCVKCGYNLTGNTSGVCPECGTEANR